jgi:hypothetical protein
MKVVGIILCVAGCSAQIIMLTMLYMSYDISTSVTYSFEDKMKLPALTVCANILELVDWEHKLVASQCSDILGSNCTHQKIQELGSYNMEQRFALNLKLIGAYNMNELMQITGDFSQIFIGHTRYNPLTDALDKVIGFDQTFLISEFLLGIKKCFTLSWREEFALGDYFRMKQQCTIPGLLTMLARYEATSSPVRPILSVTYSHPDVKVRSSNSEEMSIPRKGFSSSSFEIIRSKILEPPFATNCIDYRKVYNVADRAECYESCVSWETFRLFEVIPLGIRVEVKDTHGLRYMKYNEVKKNVHLVYHISQACSHRCSRHDCRQTIYTSSMKSSADEINNTNNSMTGHMFYVPTVPTVTTECTAKVGFAEFATDISSTLGFWFGLSILTLFSWTEMLVKRVASRIHARTQIEEIRRNARKRKQVPIQLTRAGAIQDNRIGEQQRTRTAVSSKAMPTVA